MSTRIATVILKGQKFRKGSTKMNIVWTNHPVVEIAN